MVDDAQASAIQEALELAHMLESFARVAQMSIGQLFIAAAVPGILAVFLYWAAIWVVILPPGVSVGTTPDAYHASVNISGLNYPYAAIPGSGAIPGDSYFEGQNPFFPTAKMRGQDIAISHEVYEAVTDSAGMGWWAPACAGQEVADLCEGLVTDPIDGYTLSSFWSNAAQGCVGPANLNTTTPKTPPCGCAENKDTLAEACTGTLCCPRGTGDCGGYCCRCVGTTCS